MTTQLDGIRDKVRSILERANHPNTPQAEAETALSLAYRLMKKYDLDEHEMAKNSGRDAASDEIKIQNFEITGPYRVRRGTLLYTIAKALSCTAYRDCRASLKNLRGDFSLRLKSPKKQHFGIQLGFNWNFSGKK